mgnify:CR=1 FL=1
MCWTQLRGGLWVAPKDGVLRDAAASAATAAAVGGAASSPGGALAAALVAVAALPLLELPPGVGELMTKHMVGGWVGSDSVELGRAGAEWNGRQDNMRLVLAAPNKS